MTFSKRTKCSECNSPLHLQDINTCDWKEDVQEFVFICSSCTKENIVKIKLFDSNGHIRQSYLATIKDDPNYLNSEQLKKVSKHLEICEICKDRINQEYLDEVEEKVKFNEKTMKFFEQNYINVNFEVKDNLLIIDGEVYQINEQEEFYRRNSETCYYLKKDNFLIALICLKDNVVYKMWKRPKVRIQQTKNFVEKVINGEIKLKLETLDEMFRSLVME